jgi:hypothetical protein
MKIVFTILLVILAVLACGCTSTSPSAPATPAAGTTPAAASPATPSLIGMWNGTILGYDEGTGYTDYGNVPMSMIVTEQQGRLFSGNLTFNFNGTESTVPMAGVMGRDGRTFAIVENNNGYTTGEIIGGSEIQLTHLDDSQPISVALDSLKKV